MRSPVLVTVIIMTMQSLTLSLAIVPLCHGQSRTFVAKNNIYLRGESL